MFVKCPCSNCSNHLEFDQEHAGESVACPSCGIDTVLFIPKTVPPATRVKKWTVKEVALKILPVFGITAGIAFALFAFSAVDERSGGRALPMLGTVLLYLAAFIVAVLWFIFPLFMYVKMDKVIKLLKDIEFNTRQEKDGGDKRGQ